MFAQLSSSLAADGLDLPLPELHTEGLDAEQVWMQIEMQLEPLLGKAKGALRRLRPAISAGDEFIAERLLKLPANAQGKTSGSDEEEAPEWEPFNADVEYDIDGEDEDDDDDDDEEEEEKPEASKTPKDLTSKLFKDPGMFNLTEMENFALQAEAEEEERLAREERREQRRRKALDSGGGEDDEDESESEENVLDDDSEEDDDDDSDDDSEDDDVADLIGNAARLAGVALPRGKTAAASRRDEKKSMKKKGKDITFADFFGDAKTPEKFGRNARRLDEDELSDREEDVFTAMERGEMESRGGSDEDSDEDEDALDQEDEDALREELERDLADELAAESDEDAEADADADADAEADADADEDADEDDADADADADEEEAHAHADADTVAARALAARRDYEPSAFQRAQEKLKRQIKSLEERALDEKTWLLKGEASAKERPKNSVLEADVEFDHVAAPPPVVSEEMTAQLEDIIKSRIAEQRFDDVERVEPSLTDPKRRQNVELDDVKSKKGLGDIYADAYVARKHASKSGSRIAEDEKEEPLVTEARSLFRALATKLDSLSNFHFAPKPTVAEMQIKTDAPALQLEEVAPLMASGASRKAPEEVFAGGGAGGARGGAAGDVKADGELSKEDRKSARAKRKRKAKAVGNERERVKMKREREKEAKEKAAEDAGFTRKTPKVAMLAAAPAGGRSKSEFSKSSKVFGLLQEAKEADALGLEKPKKSDGMKNKAALKL